MPPKDYADSTYVEGTYYAYSLTWRDGYGEKAQRRFEAGDDQEAASIALTYLSVQVGYGAAALTDVDGKEIAL